MNTRVIGLDEKKKEKLGTCRPGLWHKMHLSTQAVGHQRR
jgi:hypothetical protein